MTSVNTRFTFHWYRIIHTVYFPSLRHNPRLTSIGTFIRIIIHAIFHWFAVLSFIAIIIFYYLYILHLLGVCVNFRPFFRRKKTQVCSEIVVISISIKIFSIICYIFLAISGFHDEKTFSVLWQSISLLLRTTWAMLFRTEHVVIRRSNVASCFLSTTVD